MDFQFKMVEEKDMCSSPSVRAPKRQLAVERPLTEDIGSHQKKKRNNALCPNTMKKLQQDGRMGTNTIKSNPIHAKRETHKLKNNNTQEVLFLGYESSELHVRLTSLRIWQRNWESAGIWLWRPAGFDYRTSAGLGEIETPHPEGTNKILHTPKFSRKE